MKNSSEKTVFSGWVFKLIIMNVIMYVLQLLTAQIHVAFQFGGITRNGPSVITFYLGLTPALVFGKGYIWQVFSYMFLHDTNNFIHLFFNMYALFLFGIPIEDVWGGKKFIYYYLFCGIFAGITIFVINIIGQGMGYVIPTIGASGAIFGLLLAFGILFPDIQLILFFLIPIKAKYLVIIYGAIEIFLEFMGDNSNVSHIGHLGGLAGGLIFFFIINRREFKFKFRIRKADKIKRKSSRINLTDEDHQKKKIDDNKNYFQINILKKIKESGIESLTDDEIQYIKYLEIMTGNTDDTVLCHDSDLNVEDSRCQDCENFRVCFLREIKKYM